MSEAVFRRESAVEYFKELVEGALARQGVNVGELTAFYVVHLLTGFLQRPAANDAEPLALKLARRSNRAAFDSAPRCGKSATCRCSFPDSSRTPCVVNWWMSTITSPLANTPTAR